eukprot:s411_g11.t1
MASQAGSVSSPLLPSISSVQPLRRSTSLTSRQRVSAADHWEATLRRRLGTPGPPPERNEVPGLYDAPRLPMVRVLASGASKSAPSTVGPSASVVAWFAQYQCTKCGQVPTSLEARFCHLCGESLPLPRVPGAVTGGSSRLAKNLGEVAAAAALEVMQSEDWKGRDRSSKVSAKSLPAEKPVDKESQRSNAEKEKVPAKEVQFSDSKSSPELKEIKEIKGPKKLIEHVQHAVQHARKDALKDIDGRCEPSLGVRKAKSGRHGDGSKRMLPGRQGKAKELPWGTRESQVAHWLDNIRPRRP